MSVPVEGVAGGGTAYGFNDGGLNSEPLKQSTDPTEVPTSDLVHVWCMPNTVNVGSQETPRPLETVTLLLIHLRSKIIKKTSVLLHC